MSYHDYAVEKGVRGVGFGILANLTLGAVKLLAGIFGNSYALVADAIESWTDVFTSGLVLVGLKISRKPPDDNHPYGHGKVEPLAGAVISIGLILAAFYIAVGSFKQIQVPHEVPEKFTLLVLVATILIKEWFSKWILEIGIEFNSSALKAEAWHHRSDAVTSAAAFVGISVALIGGSGWEMSDDIAALFASAAIFLNGIILFRGALHELLDAAPDSGLREQIIQTAIGVQGVKGTHKCHVRKLGLDYYVDLDILCNPEETIRFGHDLAHNVGEAIHAKLPQVTKVLVHVEPEDDFGRRSRN